MKLAAFSLLMFGATLAGCASAKPQIAERPTVADTPPPPNTVEQAALSPALQPSPQHPPERPKAGVIESQVGAALAASGIDASRIQIDTPEDGVVVLKGTVGSEQEKRRAHEIAHSVPGVRNVYIGQLEIDTAQALR